MSVQHPTLNRRDWLRGASFVMAGAAFAAAETDGMPDVANPRATSGDAIFEPDWDQRLTITVGRANADIIGDSEKAIQAAVEYLARYGGGTVHVLPGRYTLRNSVFLRSGVRLLGSGDDTELFKAPSVETQLSADSDWYDQEITLENSAGFNLGDGICLRAKSPHDGGAQVLKRTLIARSGNRFKLDRALRENFWMSETPTVASLFPLVTAEEERGMVIENIALDGNRNENLHLDGNYSGCVWIQDCSDVLIRGVTARNNNGDGISWQVCHDVVVENCHSHDNADLGFHPGSGAQRPLMRNNRLMNNNIGIFFCWGVKYGLAEGNQIVGNNCGISIGHRDNHNHIRNNDVRDSVQVGVLFRPERGEGFTANGNILEGNRIVNNGPEDGAAVDVQGVTSDNTIVANTIEETRGPAARAAIRLGEQTGDMDIRDNVIEGFATAVQDLRTS